MGLWLEVAAAVLRPGGGVYREASQVVIQRNPHYNKTKSTLKWQLGA